MAGKCGKRQIEETDELSFLPSAIKKDRSRRRRLQMQLAQPKTIFEFGLPSIVAYSQRNITVPRPVPSCGGFLQDSFILSLSLKTMTRSTPPNCLLSNPLYSHRFQVRNTAYKSGLCTSSKFISCSRNKRNTYLPALSALPAILFQKDQNKLGAHDKNRERAELWVKIN